MSNILIPKTAAEAVRDALAALIESEKGRQTKTAADQEAQAKQVQQVKAAATAQADLMLQRGLITKEGHAKTVENLSDPVTALPYLKKALDLLEKAQAKTEQPTPIGRGTKTAAAPSGKQSLEEAGRRFDKALGL